MIVELESIEDLPQRLIDFSTHKTLTHGDLRRILLEASEEIEALRTLNEEQRQILKEHYDADKNEQKPISGDDAASAASDEHIV